MTYVQLNSENGYYLTPRSRILQTDPLTPLRVFVVYVQIAGNDNISEWPNPDDNNCDDDLNCAPPYWETGGGSYSEPEPIFDADFPGEENITEGSVTDYYYQASFGLISKLKE